MSGPTDGKEPPRRTVTEPTLVLNRHEISEKARRALDEAAKAYPNFAAEGYDEPDSRGLLSENQEGARDRETLIRCPACKACPCCKGATMVTFDRAESWKGQAEGEDASLDVAQ